MVQEVLPRGREPWRWGAQSAAVRDWQQPVERIIETDRSSYNDTGGHQRTQCWPFYGHSAFEASWKGEKSSISGCLMSLQNRKKKHFGELSSLILCNNNEPFLDWVVICDNKWILYNNRQWPAQLLDWEKAPKHFTKPILHQENVSGHWSASGLIHYSLLNSRETIPSEKYAQQINETPCKLQRLQPAFVNRKGPILLHDNALLHITQPTLWKLNESGYEVLPHPPYSPDLSPNDYHFLKHLDTFL